MNQTSHRTREFQAHRIRDHGCASLRAVGAGQDAREPWLLGASYVADPFTKVVEIVEANDLAEYEVTIAMAGDASDRPIANFRGYRGIKGLKAVFRRRNVDDKRAGELTDQTAAPDASEALSPATTESGERMATAEDFAKARGPARPLEAGYGF